MPCSISKAARQWAKEVGGWMIDKAQLGQVKSVSQLYTKQGSSYSLVLVGAKVNENLFMAKTIELMKGFSGIISEIIEAGKVIINEKITLSGCDIGKNVSVNIGLCLNKIMNEIGPSKVDLDCQKR